MSTLTIDGREIGVGRRPYLIAEMSGNHNKSLERAFDIVGAAAKAGADAVKLQTYTADTMTLNTEGPGFVIDDPTSLWNGRHLYDLYKEASTPWEWHGPIMERAASLGMHCFSTPFDATAVDFLESLRAPAYKIASFECTDLPLIRKVASTGKPMIISTGMASLEEIRETVETARASGAREIVLLKCTSTYPASPENSNLLTIPDLRAATGCEVGLSDHTMGVGVAVAAVALGAVVVEKHFTLRRADGGVDSAFSMEPQEFALMREEADRAHLSIGGVVYGGTAAEQPSKVFRRSLYIGQDLRRGDVLTAENVRIIRPGYGLPPKDYDAVIGRRVTEDLKAGRPLSWDVIEAAVQ